MNGQNHTSEVHTIGYTSIGARLAVTSNAVFGVDPRSLAVCRIGVLARAKPRGKLS